MQYDLNEVEPSLHLLNVGEATVYTICARVMGRISFGGGESEMMVQGGDEKSYQTVEVRVHMRYLS